ncbi:aldose 1-epimerase [Alteraurantiacibacter aquimixticola]|uniref:Aldose 1-epimerase n=1 Tax=Alteraurantiacibacter aquimixticola TaxID=2489173 RepID=A0A4T3F3V9_9SPHN|nr:aldose 1-epimerase [Alteraurantiacibacter aquimixticola]TIX50974.1 aldose 1-epimerase [Alteraurantiacibacter aquimixticola]
MSGLIELSGGGWQAGVLPEMGGWLTSLTCNGTEVLRTMPAGSREPLQAACFPLVPYTNRIADGAFRWLGDTVQLPRNFAPETCSIHGMGWKSEWRVVSGREFKCAMVHEWEGLGPRPWKAGIDRWPWAYHAQQRIRLGPKGCAITLNLTNRSNVPMPAGLGLHPYFRRRRETRLSFRSNGIWMVDEAQIPTGEIAPSDRFADFASGAPLPAETIDHCYLLWDGVARIKDDLGTITLTATGAPYLHVYAPADGSALCLEPVSHMPDALNQDPAGITSLPPGCSASLQMEISAE